MDFFRVNFKFCNGLAMKIHLRYSSVQSADFMDQLFLGALSRMAMDCLTWPVSNSRITVLVRTII